MKLCKSVAIHFVYSPFKDASERVNNTRDYNTLRISRIYEVLKIIHNRYTYLFIMQIIFRFFWFNILRKKIALPFTWLFVYYSFASM